MNKNYFSHRLKQIMKDLTVTNEDLSTETGISVNSLIAYKSGKVSPSLDKVIAIADYFEVSIDWLCGRNYKLYTLSKECELNEKNKC